MPQLADLVLDEHQAYEEQDAAQEERDGKEEWESVEGSGDEVE